MKGLLFTVLSRGLLILVLLALVAGYYYRAALFPEFFAEPEVAAEVPGEEAATAPPATEQAAAEAPQAAADNTGQAGPGQADETLVVTASEEPPPPVAPAVPLSGEGVQWPEAPAEQPAAETGAVADSAETPADIADAQADVDVAANAAEQAEQAPAAAADTGLTPLERARNAYWAGKVKDALAAYQEAVAAHPDDPDAQGELGNLHFAEGNWQAAADAYLAAGRALVERRDLRAAEHLAVVLDGLDPEHAKTLRAAIEQQHGGAR